MAEVVDLDDSDESSSSEKTQSHCNVHCSEVALSRLIHSCDEFNQVSKHTIIIAWPFLLPFSS